MTDDMVRLAHQEKIDRLMRGQGRITDQRYAAFRLASLTEQYDLLVTAAQRLAKAAKDFEWAAFEEVERLSEQLDVRPDDHPTDYCAYCEAGAALQAARFDLEDLIAPAHLGEPTQP